MPDDGCASGAEREDDASRINKGSMKAYTEHQGLEQLPELVKKQRRLIAGTLRIVREEKALRNEIDALLVEAGLQVGQSVNCDGFEVTHKFKDGEAYATVVKIQDDAGKQ